jgi:hypothetical protein
MVLSIASGFVLLVGWAAIGLALLQSAAALVACAVYCRHAGGVREERGWK